MLELAQLWCFQRLCPGSSRELTPKAPASKTICFHGVPDSARVYTRFQIQLNLKAQAAAALRSLETKNVVALVQLHLLQIEHVSGRKGESNRNHEMKASLAAGLSVGTWVELGATQILRIRRLSEYQRLL